MAGGKSEAAYAGVSGAYDGESLGLKISMATFLGVGLYNAIELCILISITFNRYHGLYFWSLLLASIAGVIPYSIGFLLKFYQLMDSLWLSLVFLTVGWWFMITGQSLVLYSRLHLVLREPATLRRVLIMIIANIFLLHVPTSVLTFGSNSTAKSGFVRPYDIVEKIQMTGFCLQELIISTLYIWEAVKMLRISPEKGNRRIMYQLLVINFVFILMDAGLLGCAFSNLYVIETTLKSTIYSIKLKLEFAVLGKLVHLVNSHVWNVEFKNGQPSDIPDFVDPSRLAADVTHAPKCGNSPPKPPWSHDIPADMGDMEARMSHNDTSQRQSAHGSAWGTVTPGRATTPDNSRAAVCEVPGVIPPAHSNGSSVKDWPT